MAASSAWRPVGPLVLLAAAAAAGGCLGLLVAALAPTRFTAVELLLVAPPPGRHQSAAQTRYAAGIQRVVGELADVRAGREVRMVVTPDLPLIEIDATARSGAAAAARAGAAATTVEAAWRDRTGGAGPRLVRMLPAAVSVRRTSPNAAVDGLAGAVLGGTAAIVVAAAAGRWPRRASPREAA
jgi:hypothetical protein